SIYDLEDFEGARTHDPIWNAAQTQLLKEGKIHNYMRMLWGKKILEWAKGPKEALFVMEYLNNYYALDGRDPNSYTGIFWVMGRHDRPWPERPIFGAVRYMSTESAKRKLGLKTYLQKYSTPQ
ncbi:MAG: deoxyribodipyrimidine photolyase, partial [Desulfatiglandales bacterium]